MENELLQTVDRALQLLNHFSSHRLEWTLTELANSLGISKSMTLRLIHTLEAHGYVRQVPDSKRYRLGRQVLNLGAVASEGFDLVQIAHGTMVHLAQWIGETVQLTVCDMEKGLCLHRVESGQPLKYSLRSGETSPMYAGASNKVILAFLPDHEVEQILKAGLQPITPSTITDRRVLQEHLNQIRKQGWDFSDSELTLYVTALAVPITRLDGRLVGSLSVAGPNSRFTNDRAMTVLPDVQQAAAEISRQLPRNVNIL